MTTESLDKVLSVIEKIKPEEFDMRCIYNIETKQKDIVGHLYHYANPNLNVDNYHYLYTSGAISLFIINFLQATPWTADEYNKVDYLVSAYWADNPITNTVEHLKYRIEMLKSGYQPKSIRKAFVEEIKILI